MTITPGHEWGTVVANPGGEWRQGSEIDLAVHVAAGSELPFALTRGELHKVLGRPVSAVSSAECRLIPVDMLEVVCDVRSGETVRHIVSSVVLRSKRLRGFDLAGPLIVISNFGLYRGVEFSARAHPNDGRAELLRATGASMRERLVAFSRMRSHTFVSSESVRSSQISSDEIDVAPGTVCVLDGRKVPAVVRVQIRVLPDCTSVYIAAS